ncbi:unnamed protein product [Caenorhabditis angaria]|uniref:CULT domain-containing protein n=1 Tax=Caenorhabditis angaria TaxID=860376 RepID=A0A9P1J5U6_9PELO|nr:unnamed protein product [Caenorhabditis angaria]
MHVSIVFLFVSTFIEVQSRHLGELICRQCGLSITRQSELINATGVDEEQLKYKYEFPLVGKNTSVHVLKNPAGEQFHVFGAKTANLKFHGPAQLEATWYPGMQWTICLCKSCGAHMGWYFQPKTPFTQKDQKSFIGIVLDNVISADYSDTLTRTPL